MRFTTDNVPNGQLGAVFQLVNQATGQVTSVTIPFPITLQPTTSCTILDLTIPPIDLFLLGLHLHTDTIHIVLTAQRGTLLGNLLCGLFFGPNPLGALAGQLTAATQTGGLAITTIP